jgi:tight adherence protein C
MSGTSVEAPSGITETPLAIHIGEMQFGPLEGCILGLALAAILTSGLKLWRLAQSEDRQQLLLEALRGDPHDDRETSPTQRLTWYQRFGAVVAASQVIGTAGQQALLAALMAAGVRGHGHLAATVAAKVCAGVGFVPLVWLLMEWRQFFAAGIAIRLVVLAGAFLLGWRCPEVVLSRLAARRRLRLETGMPDALDLLVICAEAGLSLDHSIEQVGRVLRSASPEVAEEFAATAAEMRVSPARGQALQNLAMRTGVTSLRSIVATLNQSIKFGTPLAESLRMLAAEMRAERLARFEERAARLPVLLTLPLMVCILPSLMIVIGTPLALRIIDMLGRSP